MKKISFYDEMYNIKYTVFVGGNSCQAFKCFAKELGIHIDDYIMENDALGTTFFRDESICIWVEDISPSALHISVLAHECYHATNMALQWRGVAPAKDSDDEHYAYYLSYLIEKIITEFRNAK